MSKLCFQLVVLSPKWPNKDLLNAGFIQVKSQRFYLVIENVVVDAYLYLKSKPKEHVSFETADKKNHPDETLH